MNINQVYNFFFHPLDHGHSPMRQALSIVTIVALTLFSRGIFALIFAFVNGLDHKVPVAKIGSQVNVPKPLIVQTSEATIHPPLVQSRMIAEDDWIQEEGLDESEEVLLDHSKVEHIREKQEKQLECFEKWAQANQWHLIHQAHYDWWMFPVERPSRSYRDQYSMGRAEVERLKKDRTFMENYKRGMILVVQAWGWDLEKERAIDVLDPKKSCQAWTGYGVRLAKMSDSLLLFGEMELHKKLRIFFNEYCLPQQHRIPISNLVWLRRTLPK